MEHAWESYLRGRDGELRVVVDVRGREMASRTDRRKKLFKEGKWVLFGVTKLGSLNGNTLDPNR